VKLLEGRRTVTRSVAGLVKRTFSPPRHMWTDDEVRAVREYASKNPASGIDAISRRFRRSPGTVRKIVHGHSRLDAGGPIRPSPQFKGDGLAAKIRRAGFVKTNKGYAPMNALRTQAEVMAEIQF